MASTTQNSRRYRQSAGLRVRRRPNDEFTREDLEITVDRCVDADGVVAVLGRLAGWLGAPSYALFDHSSEFVAQAVNDRFLRLHTLSF